MADALTRTQVEILRRARDADDVASGHFLLRLLSEISSLTKLGLIKWDGNLRCSLTSSGERYLAAIEGESAANPRLLLDPRGELES